MNPLRLKNLYDTGQSAWNLSNKYGSKAGDSTRKWAASNDWSGGGRGFVGALGDMFAGGKAVYDIYQNAKTQARDQASLNFNQQQEDNGLMNQAEWDKLYAAINQPEYKPSIPDFNPLETYESARKRAEKAINPVYEDKIQRFMNRQSELRGEARQTFDLTAEDINASLDEALQENQVSRTRTSEDVAAAIGQLNTQESQYQLDEGEEFNYARENAIQQLANSGMLTSGLGGQQMAERVRRRNIDSERTTDQFDEQREQKRLFETRTFEDLARADEQVEGRAERQTEQAEFDLESTLDEIAYNTRVQKEQFEIDRLGEILSRTESNYNTTVRSIMNDLIKSGRDTRDIDAFARIAGTL